MFDRVLVINYNSFKDCFLHCPSKYLPTGACVKLIYGDNQVSYLSVSASESKIIKDVYIGSVYAKLLGIKENQPVTVTEVSHLATVNRLTVSPVNSTDYEILELVSENVQTTLLDQIRVVYSGQKFIIWVGSNINIAVYVESVEPNSPGVIDFLTEVIIKPKSDDAEKKSLISSTEINENNSSVFNMDELTSLKNFFQNKVNEKQVIQFKENIICRLVPLSKVILACGIQENYKDFNVFISKQSLPKTWTSKNFPIISSMNLLTNDLFEKEIFVKLCLLEDSQDLSPLSYLCLIDTIFVSNIVFKQFNSKIGCRVILRLVEEKPIVTEINIITKKNYLLSIEDKFKSYIAKDCDEIFVLNQDVPINIGDHVKCNLKFSPPEAKFCIVDNNLISDCKFLVTEGTSTSEESNEDPSIHSTFVENISNYTNIINDAVSIYSGQENHWENILITGRPGTGKSTLLKLIADKINSYPTFIFTKIINCKAIKGKTVDSLLKVFFTAFSELILNQPSVLLLDDLHLLCENVKGDEVAPNAVYSHRVSEMMHTYLSVFSQFNKIGICATTESTSKLHKNIYSSRGSHLFKNLFSINDISKADRILLLKHFFDEYRLVNVNFEYISIKTDGYVVQDMIDFCKKTIFEAYKSGCDTEAVTVNEDHYEKALKNTCILSLQNVHLHSPGSKNFSDIGGLHEVKKILVESLMWPAQFPNIFGNAPLRLQSGLLLYGAPGTGKTLLAAAAAKQCGLRLISIKGPELLSKYIGASEQAVRDVFQSAQSARPCILFFDEFDSLAPRRGHDNTGVTDRVVNQLLTQLDGVESLSGVCVLAATSRPDLLDPALLRPGRLDRQILCPLPSKGDRLEILTVLSKNVDFSEDVNLEVLAVATEGYSGADLQSILYTAQLSTIDYLLDDSKESAGITNSRITQDHLKDALRKTRPSLPEQERLKYEKIYTKFQGGTTIDEFIAGSKATLA